MATKSSQNLNTAKMIPNHSNSRKSHLINHTYKIGECVEISQSRVAIIKYIGRLKDVRGIWYGIEFIDGSVGSHNGTFKGSIYFNGADKRCEFIQKGDIRRKLKMRGNSTRNIHSNSNMMHSSTTYPVQPQLPLNQLIEAQKKEKSVLITLKLRCMCFADPIPIELRININDQTMRSLKREIVNQCNNNTNLPLFKSIINNNNYSNSVDLYQLTMNQQNMNNNKVRINNLNVKPGNMAYCILKKNEQLFKKLTLNQNGNENTDNVPLKYYKLKNGQLLFVLFKFEVNIKILFQKTLFRKHISSNIDTHSAVSSGYEEKQQFNNNHDSETNENKKSIFSDNKQYIHQHIFTANIADKFDKLYLKLMQWTDINNINGIKLLSNNFIYNKSMMIEKFVYNEIDENDGNNNELCLYFIHLHQQRMDNNNNNNRTKHGYHHMSRSRNFSVASNYSTYSTFTHYVATSGTTTAGTTGIHSNRSSVSSIHQLPMLPQQYGSKQKVLTKIYTKVLLNFVSAKKSESYTIIDDNITIKRLRHNIRSKYKIECDRIKWNNDILMDDKLIKQYNINTNDILHIFDESNIIIQISQSQLSSKEVNNKTFDIKINKNLSIKHIKYEISKILRYPMVSQTLILKDILKDNQQITECGIKTGDTIRLVYNFGKRVKKLPNNKLKIPIITFNTNKRFEVIVNKNIFIYEIMQIIQREKGIDINKQQLLFHGINLEQEERLISYDITHEMHLYINK